MQGGRFLHNVHIEQKTGSQRWDYQDLDDSNWERKVPKEYQKDHVFFLGGGEGGGAMDFFFFRHLFWLPPPKNR